MNRNWAIAGVVVIAILLVGGTLLMDRDRSARPVDAGGSVSPQTAAVALGRVATPPARTVAFVDPGNASEGSAYTVDFVPYGTGPAPKTLVIAVGASVPSGAVTKPFDLAGRSVLVSTSRLPAKMAVTKGGRYAGEIVLVRQGDVLVPMLIRSAAVE